MKKKLKISIAAIAFMVFGHTVFAQRSVTYNFNTDLTGVVTAVNGGSPAVGALPLAPNPGTSRAIYDGDVQNLTAVLRHQTIGGLINNTCVNDLTSFPSTADYSVTWKEYINTLPNATINSHRRGFLLRGQSVAATPYAPGMRNGYFFNLLGNTSGQIQFQIRTVTGTTFSTLSQSANINLNGGTIPMSVDKAYYYRVSATGSNPVVLKFEYSLDGITFTTAVTHSDSSPTRIANAGLTQTITGIGFGSYTYHYLDNIKFDNLDPVTYYYNGTGLLTDVTSWGTNTDGTGDAPLNFTTNAQIFEIRNTTSVALDGLWTVSGAGSKVRIGNATQPAITLTLNSGSSIGPVSSSNVDIVAPSSGNHTIVHKNTADLSYGAVTDSNLAIVFDNSIISSSNLNYTFGSVDIINSSFITYLHRPVIKNLTVDATSVLTAPTGPTNAYIAIPSGGSVVINGRLKIPQLTGFVKSSVGTATSQNGNIQFLGTENLTLGETSIVEYSGSGVSQIVDVRTDYKNLRFTGTASKNISAGTTVAGTITVNQAAPVTLSGDLTVNGIVFTSGKITTGANTLTIGASGTITGASQATGWVVGKLKKLTDTSASPSFIYTIGDATTYAPVALTFTGNTSAAGGLTASTFAGDHTAIGESAINASKNVNRTWTLTNDSLASFGTYSADFTFASSETDADTTPARYVAGLYNGTTWSSLATSNASSTGATASGITGFGDYAIGEATTVLPVADTAYNFCTGAKVSAIVAATGTGVKVYAAATGGVALGDVALKGTAVLPVAYFLTEPTLGGGESARVRVFVRVNALPATPATVVLTDDNAVLPATSSTAVTAVGAFVGTNTPFKLTATAVGAVSYRWILPAGVVRTDATGATTDASTTSTDGFIYVKFTQTGVATPLVISVQSVNASGCSSVAKPSAALTRLLPAAPAAIVVTDASLPVPAGKLPAALKSFAIYMGSPKVLTLTATASPTATSYAWELPAGVTQLSGGTSNVITVNFEGVTDANTGTYTDTKGILTHVLRIGVKAVNGVGSSITDNQTKPLTPATDSKAKLVTLTAVKPAASALMLTSTQTVAAGAKPVAITAISNLLGQNGVYKLDAKVSPLASSYLWNLPSSVTRVTAVDGVEADDSTTSTDPFIYVKFDQPKPASGLTGSLYFGVKAVNGIGSSDSSTANATKFAEITGYAASFSLLKLALALPTVGKVTGTIANACANVAQAYTIAPSLASSYVITAPAGTVVTSASNLQNATNVLTTSDLTFTVNYNNLVFTKTAKQSIAIKAVNQVGINAKDLILAITTVTCTPASRPAATKTSTIADTFNVVAYPNPSSDVFTLEVQSSAKGNATTKVQVYDMTGRLIEQRQAASKSVEIGNNYPTGVYNVIVNQGDNTKTVRVIKK